MMRQRARLSMSRSMRPFSWVACYLDVGRVVMVTVVLRYGLGLIDEAKRDQQTKERDVMSTED
jgi:hypothetical protein